MALGASGGVWWSSYPSLDYAGDSPRRGGGQGKSYKEGGEEGAGGGEEGREEGEAGVGGGRGEGKREGGERRKILRAQSARRSRREEGEEGAGGGGKGAGGGEAYPLSTPPRSIVSVVVADEACCSPLDPLNRCSLLDGIRVPDGCCIFKRWSNNGVVCSSLQPRIQLYMFLRTNPSDMFAFVVMLLTCISTRSCCRIDVSRLDVMRGYRSESSAYNLISDDFTSGISLMNDNNNRGPRTVPWGTPDSTSAVDDVNCSVEYDLLGPRCFKEVVSHWLVLPLTP